MRICPTCRTAYPARGRSTCTKDGTRLVAAEEYAASRNDPLLGRSVAGRFHVIERVGTGGMGTVYRAEQSGLDRPVALKVLKKELVSDRDTVVRFHREAKAMSMLMHPNTVRVFDFGEDDDGYLFLAMELLEGELLTSWIEREGTPPVEEAVEAIREILRSLAEAHSKGIIHRDLKPDNIFLARVDGHFHPVVKVLDFGIAKVFRDDAALDELETQAGTVFGTPRYMSPEQAQGKVLDHRSDLYAVGVLLYQLLTGRPPFLDDDAVVVMAKHIRDTPEPPRKLAADRPIPRSLDKIVQRALKKEPDDRFKDADEFESALAACIPDIEAEEARLASGRHSGILLTVSGLPRVPLVIAGAILLFAVGFASFLVIDSGGEADPAEAADVDPIAGPPEGPPPEDEAPPEPVVEMTEVTLTSVPGGAGVYLGDQRVATTPHVFRLREDEAMRVTLRLSDHEPMDIELRGDSGDSREVTLVAAEPEPEEPEPQRPRPRVRPREPGPGTPPPSESVYERFD